MVLSNQSMSKNLKKWGFASYHESVHDSLNKGLQNFARKQSKRIQSGGRVTMPQEYFGINSGKYLNVAPGPSLTVTNEMIRPAMDASDPTGVITGGGQKHFQLSQAAINQATSGMGLSSSQKKQIKLAFEEKTTELFNKVQQKGGYESHLSAASFDAVWKMKKYSSLH